MKLNSAVLLACLAAQAFAQDPPCKSGDMDFTPLKGKKFSFTSGDYTYDVAVCEASTQTCPDDQGGVTTGMVVQTDAGGDCWVLGVFDSPLTPPVWNGASLKLADGSSVDCPLGSDRETTVNFKCADKAEPAGSDISIQDEGTCAYALEFPTCYACKGGCKGGSGGGGGGGGGNTGAMGFFGIFFIIFVSTTSVYCIGGIVFNVYKREKKGLEAIPNREFWGALPGYTKEGVVYSSRTSYQFIKSKTGGGGSSSEYSASPDAPDTESYQGGESPTKF